LVLTAASLVVLGTVLDGVRQRPARAVGAGALVGAALVLLASNLRALDSDVATRHYRGACTLVLEDVRKRRPRPKPSRVLIASEVPQLHALVWYGIACNVYSDYFLQHARWFARDVDSTAVRAADAAYYISWREPQKLPRETRWRRLEGDPDAGPGTPAVFVAEAPATGTR
jgi:hypothetical protein